MRCISTSEWADTARLKRKNLCWASRATEAEAPRPKKWICRAWIIRSTARLISCGSRLCRALSREAMALPKIFRV
ncbi:hypothetical protein D3C81_1961020 [compost metagenome]